MSATIFLIPCPLADEKIETIPLYIIDALRKTQVIFAENERSARRFLKLLDKAFVIDDFEWFTIGKNEEAVSLDFKQKIKESKTIAIISEAGCPGVADPGQGLVSIAQEMNCCIRPFVGPNSMILALMASGLNGQQFEFIGYLPVDSHLRATKIKELEAESAKNNSTKIFIETPYRNNALFDALLQHSRITTKLCIAFHLTADNESIRTQTIAEWKKNKPVLEKQPAIFLIFAGR